MSESTQKACLEGIRVLAVTHFLAGPIATGILGDLGADIWKIERIKTGDAGRTFGPFKNGESGWFHAFNKDTHSITLNYTKPEGRELFLELAKECDVIVENNAAGVMTKYHVGYDDVVKVNPRIIFCSISGFGQENSPYIHKVALDGVAQAFGGIISMNGFKNQPGLKVGPGICDEVSGYMAAMSILAALFERERSGKGQFIDVAMADVSLNITEHATTYFSFTGKNLERSGNGHPSIGMTGCYDTLEGKSTFYMNVPSDKFANIVFDTIGRPELKDDSRCNSNKVRHDNADWLDDIINEYTSKYKRDDIIEEFMAAGLPVMPVNTVEECMRDPHYEMRKEIRYIDHPVIGKFAVNMTPFSMSRTPLVEPKAAENIGQSNENVYGKVLGKSEEELADLKSKGII